MLTPTTLKPAREAWLLEADQDSARFRPCKAVQIQLLITDDINLAALLGAAIWVGLPDNDQQQVSHNSFDESDNDECVCTASI